jgi:hypothetical protein
MSRQQEARSTCSDVQSKVQEKMEENNNTSSEPTEERAANIESQTLHKVDQLKEENDRKVQQPQR